MSLLTSTRITDTLGDAPEWLATFVERYRQAGYWQDQTFAQALDAVAARNLSAIVLSDGPLHLSYHKLADRRRRLASLQPLHLRRWDGEHFYLIEQRQTLLAALTTTLLGHRPLTFEESRS